MSMDVTLIGKDTQEMNAYNRQGNVNLFGAQLVPAPKEELEKLGLEAGVKIASVEKGKIRDAGIKRDSSSPILIILRSHRLRMWRPRSRDPEGLC